VGGPGGRCRRLGPCARARGLLGRICSRRLASVCAVACGSAADSDPRLPRQGVARAAGRGPCGLQPPAQCPSACALPLAPRTLCALLRASRTLHVGVMHPAWCAQTACFDAPHLLPGAAVGTSPVVLVSARAIRGPDQSETRLVRHRAQSCSLASICVAVSAGTMTARRAGRRRRAGSSERKGW